MILSRSVFRLCRLATTSLSLVAIAACGMFGADSNAGGVWLEGGAGGGGVYLSSGSSKSSAGTGGVESGDIIIRPPPNADAVGRERFADLCGNGCTPGGDPAECAAERDGTPGIMTEEPLSCQLVLVNGAALPRCRPAGTFQAGRPCETAADCAPGLGCEAVDGQGGICRQYCCGSVAACEPGTYCDSRPMADSAGTTAGAPAPQIPVCVPAANCELLNDSTCPAGLTCTIVREDGTTSCMAPGRGVAKEPCPCAPGFVCSMLSYECKKLCRIENAAQDCGAGARCQGGSMTYPAGFGVCVGGAY